MKMERSKYIRNGKGFNKENQFFLISQLNTNKQQKKQKTLKFGVCGKINSKREL